MLQALQHLSNTSCCTSNQESGGCAHHDSVALGSKSGWNDARDFWHYADIGLDPLIDEPVFFAFLV